MNDDDDDDERVKAIIECIMGLAKASSVPIDSAVVRELIAFVIQRAHLDHAVASYLARGRPLGDMDDAALIQRWTEACARAFREKTPDAVVDFLDCQSECFLRGISPPVSDAPQ